MELTEAQKKISTSQEFCEMQERKHKQMEILQKHRLTVEEADEMLMSRKAFHKKCGERI